MAHVEAWLRGPVPGIAPLLMPAAHALLHAAEDAEAALESLSTEEIWQSPSGAAPVGYHLQHLAGALDRLLTYARGEALSDEQRAALRRESASEDRMDAAALRSLVREAVEKALAQLRATPESALLEPRGVGRQQLPSNVLGLIVHAAEHSARHAGQAITTARVVKGLSGRN